MPSEFLEASKSDTVVYSVHYTVDYYETDYEMSDLQWVCLLPGTDSAPHIRCKTAAVIPWLLNNISLAVAAADS